MNRFASLRGADRKANIITFLLGGLVSSELMWVIRTDNQRTDFERKTNAQIAVTENIIERIKKGEKVDVKKELLQTSDKSATEDDSVDSILDSLQAMDNKWGKASSEGIIKAPSNQENNSNTTPVEKGKWL